MHQQGDLRTSKTRMKVDLDVLYYMASHYLESSPSTVASLCTTSRAVNFYLKFIRYRSIKIIFKASDSRLAGRVDEEESSAERFAKRLKEEPCIANHIKYLWIGNDDLTRFCSLPALGDSVFLEGQRERDSLCYILTRQFPALANFTLSALRYSRKFSSSGPSGEVYDHNGEPCPMRIAEAVWAALYTCVLTAPLVRIALRVDPIPIQFLHAIGHIMAIEISGASQLINSPPIVKLPSNVATKCQVRELEVQDYSYEGRHGHSVLGSMVDLKRLTALTMKGLRYGNESSVAQVAQSCSLTLATLKIFYNDFQSTSRHAGLCLSSCTALNTLTLASNCPDNGHLARLTMQSFIDSVATCMPFPLYPRSHPGLETVTLLFCDVGLRPGKTRVNTHKNWFYFIDKRIWNDFDAMLSAGPANWGWPNLKKVRIGLLASEMSSSSVEFLDKAMRSRLPKLAASGRLELVVQKLDGSLWSHPLWRDA